MTDRAAPSEAEALVERHRKLAEWCGEMAVYWEHMGSSNAPALFREVATTLLTDASLRTEVERLQAGTTPDA